MNISMQPLAKLNRASIGSALQVANFLWPKLVYEQGCFFLAVHAGSDPPPKNDTPTGWESFVNHTHVLDEFRHKPDVTRVAADKDSPGQDFVYNESHPDFVAACELGRLATRLWALKLKEAFPDERFRVYYTELDNPIVRFHAVRRNEPFWISDDDLRSPKSKWFRNAIVYDTDDLTKPVLGPLSQP